MRASVCDARTTRSSDTIPRMTCAILCIGTEITRGELVNTNTAWIAARLTEIGFEAREQVVVDDDKKRIIAAIRRLSEEASIVIVTGGLGPTTDDITSESVADLLGVPVVRDETSMDQIRERFRRLGREMSESNAKQADFPKGAEPLPNPVGTAPGFTVAIGKARAFFTPGVPAEMKKMFNDQIAPRIRDLAPNNSVQQRFKTFGLPESVVGERLRGVEEAHPGITIGYRAHIPEIEVKVLARAETIEKAREMCDRASAEVRSRLSDVIFGAENDSFVSVIARLFTSQKKTFALAESCTGGLVSSLLTKESGASDYLLMSAVTYSNNAKTALVGVPESMLAQHGAVSPEVAKAMAEGALRVSGADVALSITGIAGPGGGSESKPVGLVYFGIATKDGTITKERRFPGERNQVQMFAAYSGLHLVYKQLTAAQQS